QEQVDDEEARRLQKRLAKDKFDFNDFYKQIQQIQKMGDLKDLMGLIPGMGNMMKNVDLDNSAFKVIEAMIHSMTPIERERPDILNISRRKRIANGSGTDIAQVNRMIKQFDEMKKMMKTVAKGGLKPNHRKAGRR
ncbi:MAG: signal recognition particle protein, partial [Prevotellaceae bacterium]|nr:signal recognition particle protein [Prevotellaceae bacterium]